MTHRIFVHVWCEVDPTLNLRVDRQSGLPVVESSDVLMRVSPLGRSGIAAALKINGAEVVAFSLGERHEAALRHALAAGASRAVQLTPSQADANTEWVAPLAEWLHEQKPDLVIAERIAGRLAARLGWAHLAGVDQLEIHGEKLRAIRHLGRGNCESVTATLPAAVRLQAETLRLRYVAQARIACVSDQPIQQPALKPAENSRKEAEPGPLQLARPRTKLGAAPVAAPVSGLDRLSALMGVGRGPVVTPTAHTEPAPKNPDQMAEEFVRYLAHHNLLND